MAELFKVNAPVRKPLFEGVQGENEARSIQFDITPWVDELGNGVVTATAKRSQDSQPYPVTVTKVGNVVTWKPTSTDTAFAGVGSFQLEYTVDSVLAKTCIWSTMVAPSLDPAGDPPDPYDNWLAEMRQVAADALQSAQDADASADRAESAADGVEAVAFVNADLPTPQGAWIRYSNGERIASDATWLYVFNKNLPKAIHAFLTSDTPVLCAIAFYTTDTISTSGYMSDESVDFLSGVHNDGAWYTAGVPEGCKCIAITTKKPSATVADSIIMFDSLSALERTMPWSNNCIDSLPYYRSGQYIRYSDGALIGSGTYFGWYSMPNNGLTKVKAKMRSGDSIPAAIAFYSSETIGADSYIQSASVQAINGWGDFEADVPDNCKTIAFCTRNDDTSQEPSVQLLNADAGAIAYLSVAVAVDKANATSKKMIANIESPFKDGMCFDHLFVNQVTNAFSSEILIPSQTIFSVQASARLGFKYAEANVHKTLDSKYVVTHGISGKLGNDFETTDGQPCNDVVISQTNFSTLRSGYHYRSTQEKYRVPITSLEEFCYECKRWGMSVVLQYVDQTELNIVRGILGNNIILYSGNRDVWDGYIMDYMSLTTKEAIVARCQTIGAPYMYNMGNPHTFTDEQLVEIVNAVHNEGCLIGFVGAYQAKDKMHKYIDMGFDFNASDLQVNDFDYGNLFDISCDLDFDGITHNGTVENGVLHLEDGQSFRYIGNVEYLSKASMHITFDGRLAYGAVAGTDYMESDGSRSMWDSRFFNNEKPELIWYSNGDTYIKNLTVKVSKC